MPPLLEDPRIRQRWNQLSHNAEEATETAAAGIWTLQQLYINPCLSSVASSFEHCAGSCLPDSEERARRSRERGRTRGRAELSFDFYDDWDDQDGGRTGSLLGSWGSDELDRLLTGSGFHSGGVDNQAPRRKRGMSYGTRGLKRKSLDPDPTIIPSTSAFGFLERLPFKLGGTLRYKPSAADLQEHPGVHHVEYGDSEESELLMPNRRGDGDGQNHKGHARTRSSTNSSGATSDSFRSRGDLFTSDGEDDAVPLGDEFAMVLERRMAGSVADDRSSGKTRNSKERRPTVSRILSRTFSKTNQSSDAHPALAGKRMDSGSSFPQLDTLGTDMNNPPSVTILQIEEQGVQVEQGEEVERKRQAAARLAVECGLQTLEAVEQKRSQVDVDTVDGQKLPCSEAQVEFMNQESQGALTREVSLFCPSDFVPARLPSFN